MNKEDLELHKNYIANIDGEVCVELMAIHGDFAIVKDLANQKTRWVPIANIEHAIEPVAVMVAAETQAVNTESKPEATTAGAETHDNPPVDKAAPQETSDGEEPDHRMGVAHLGWSVCWRGNMCRVLDVDSVKRELLIATPTGSRVAEMGELI